MSPFTAIADSTTHDYYHNKLIPLRPLVTKRQKLKCFGLVTRATVLANVPCTEQYHEQKTEAAGQILACFGPQGQPTLKIPIYLCRASAPDIPVHCGFLAYMQVSSPRHGERGPGSGLC